MRIFRAGSVPDGIEGMDAVAVRPGAAMSIEEIRLAYHLAEEAFARGTNIAKKLKFEFLLWLSGTRDIRNAIEKTSPEGECIVIIFSGEGPPGQEADLPEEADPERLEGISLSRI